MRAPEPSERCSESQGRCRESITDPEVRVLAALSGTLCSDYDKGRSRLGGESVCLDQAATIAASRHHRREVDRSGWCATRDLDVAKSPDSEADRLIEGWS